MGESDDVQDFGLDQVLAALGRDLVRASEAASATPGYGLAVLEAEVELSFTVTRTTDRTGKGKLRFEVLPESGPAEVPGEIAAGHSEVRVHRIKLKLGTPAPVTATSRKAKHAGDAATPVGYGYSGATASYTPVSYPGEDGAGYGDMLRPVIERGGYAVPDGDGGSTQASGGYEEQRHSGYDTRPPSDGPHRPPDAY
jgi:hypothetical protein